MKLNVAVQMDPIARINIRGDSTFALLLEAQKRGHSLSYYTPDKLSLRGEELEEVEMYHNLSGWYMKKATAYRTGSG